MRLTGSTMRRPAGGGRRLTVFRGWCAALLITTASLTGSLVAIERALPAVPSGGSHQDEPITPIPAAPPLPEVKVALGAALFRDPRLSRNGKVSCMSCHDIASNGADGRAHDIGLDGKPLFFNTNTVFNAALSFRLNWEGNTSTLTDQARMLIGKPEVMGGTLDRIAAVVAADPALAQLYRKAYGTAPTEAGTLDAIATYERTLVTPDSRFDRFLKGDAGAITAEEHAGYVLFKTIGCIACHQGVNVGGNLYERHGIFSPLASAAPSVLRVPSLRNIAVTAPYFHDGSATTLRDAVTDMARAQLGRELSDAQTASILAFLGSLTGRFDGRTLTSPK